MACKMISLIGHETILFALKETESSFQLSRWIATSLLKVTARNAIEHRIQGQYSGI